MMRWLSWLATTLVLFSGGVVFWQATDGFAAFTTETARRLEIARSPRPLPTAALLDPHGSEIRARDLAGRVLIVDFIYTACPAVCSQLGGTFGTLQRELNDRPEGRITLLAHPDIAGLLIDEERGLIDELEATSKRSVVINSRPEFHIEQYEIAVG